MEAWRIRNAITTQYNMLRVHNDGKINTELFRKEPRAAREPLFAESLT